MRGTVIRCGNADFTGAIVDGMAAAKLQREVDDLRMKEAKWGVHDAVWRRDIESKIINAEHDYGDNRVIPLVPRFLLGVIGLVVWMIYSIAERLKTKNREG